MNALQILVISLEHSKNRQAKVASEMGKTGLAWNFLNAVDGSQLNLATSGYKAAKVKRLLGFELTPKEVGCYLSHMKAWRACVEKDVPTLIFEDDFLIAPHFESVVATLLDQFHDWQIVRLQALCDCSYDVAVDFGDYQIVGNHGDPLGATAYIVKPASAKVLLSHSLEVYEPLDHYIEHREKHGLKMLAVVPYPVTVVDPTRETSTITDRPDRRPLRGTRKLIRSVYRAFDRIFSKNPYFPQ